MKIYFLPVLLLLVLGCLGLPGSAPEPCNLQACLFDNPVNPSAAQSLSLQGARNETVSFAIEVLNPRGVLELSPIQLPDQTQLPLSSVTASQALYLPVEANRASYVRYTGVFADQTRIPRALLPLKMTGGSVDLSKLRNEPKKIVWFDIKIPPEAPYGNFTFQCQRLEGKKVVDSFPITLHIEDFVLPDARHLTLAGEVSWESLMKQFPSLFTGYAPRLLSRNDPQYANAIALLDQMAGLAHEHRVDVVFPKLQPTVKWLGGEPVFDFTEFDSVVTPWLSGTGFGDRIPAGYWPMPVADKLSEYTMPQQAMYWNRLAAHFDQLDALSRSSITIYRDNARAMTLDESYLLSESAANLLASHPRIRVRVPLQEDQARVQNAGSPGKLKPEDLNRLILAAAPLATSNTSSATADMSRWIQTDPASLPLQASADERQTRLLAFLAFIRDAKQACWESVMPSATDVKTPADPDETAWFYPGQWFGIEGVVPSIQLKWLLRAEQDYEYLLLAKQRGQSERAMTISRLLVKPVNLAPGQEASPLYSLLSCNPDAASWNKGLSLLARVIQIGRPDQTPDPTTERQLNYDLLTWGQAQSQPVFLPMAATWSPATGGIRDNVELKLSADLYNPSQTPPGKNLLVWQRTPAAWVTPSAAMDVPPLSPCTVGRIELLAGVDLENLPPFGDLEAQLRYSDDYTLKNHIFTVVIPGSFSEKRLGADPKLDGSLEDWSTEDRFFEGQMVRLIDRPTLQTRTLTKATTNSKLYSTWTDRKLYLAFRLEGADMPITNAEKNFVNRQLGRAWGEDIAEILIQPVYGSTEGPLFLLTLKPRGQLQIKRRLDPRTAINPWETFGGADLLYASNVTDSVWRGEISIPFEAMLAPNQVNGKPTYLKLNFLQHRGRTGESSSWAGPIDQILDQPLCGILQIRSGGPRPTIPR